MLFGIIKLLSSEIKRIVCVQIFVGFNVDEPEDLLRQQLQQQNEAKYHLH